MPKLWRKLNKHKQSTLRQQVKYDYNARLECTQVTETQTITDFRYSPVLSRLLK